MVDIQKLLSVVGADLMRGRREQVSTAAVGTEGDNTPYFLLPQLRSYTCSYDYWTFGRQE